MALYFIEHGPGGPVKIGFARNVTSRLQSLQSGNPVELVVLAVVPTEGKAADVRLERQLHRRFKGTRLRGEWYARTPELDEVIAEARSSHAVPGSFEALCREDGRLQRLADEVREYERVMATMPGKTLCTEFTFSRRFAPRLERLAGWGRPVELGSPTLGTRAAMDVAEAGLRSLMPPCRGCLHVLAVA